MIRRKKYDSYDNYQKDLKEIFADMKCTDVNEDENNEENIIMNGKLNKISKIFFILVAAIVIFTTVLKCGYTVNEQENAVVTTFGKPQLITDSGLHFKIPYIQKVQIVNISTFGIQIGYDEYGNSIENESLMITSDFNFVNVDFFVEGQVSDAIAYLYGAEEPEVILKTIAIACIRDTIGSYTVDEVLTTGKGQIQSDIKEKLVQRIEKENIGITVKNVTIQDSEPPTDEVKSYFKAVEDAKQNAETSVNQAKQYNSEQLPAAEATVNKTIKDAEAQKQQRVNQATAQVAKFNAMYKEYVKFPEITKERMYYETMEKLLPNVKIIIQDGNGDIVNVLNSKGGIN